MTFSENGKLAEIQGGSRDLQHASVALFAECQYIFYFTLRASAAAAPRQFSGITRKNFMKVIAFFLLQYKTA